MTAHFSVIPPAPRLRQSVAAPGKPSGGYAARPGDNYGYGPPSRLGGPDSRDLEQGSPGTGDNPMVLGDLPGFSENVAGLPELSRKYLAALPLLNKIDVQAWDRLMRSDQEFLLGAYEMLYDPGDVEQTIQRLRPTTEGFRGRFSPVRR